MNLSNLLAPDAIIKLTLQSAAATNGPAYVASTWNNLKFNVENYDSAGILTPGTMASDGYFTVTQAGLYLVRVQFAPGQLVGTGSSMYFVPRLRTSTTTLLKWPEGFISQAGTILDHGKLDGVLQLTGSTTMRLELWAGANRTHQPILNDGESNIWWSIEFIRIKS